MLLPHGYEGQALTLFSTIERYLEAVLPTKPSRSKTFTTPANYFHLLRRQLHRDFRKPLVEATPKSLLRHPKAVSTLEDFTEGAFQEVIDDPNVTAKSVKRVILCSGKIYYELLEKQEADKRNDVAIVRIEQLFPVALIRSLHCVKNMRKQNLSGTGENENMGAWPFYLQIKVPAVGESITEVTLAQWLKQDGDYVEMDENIAELESDKATFELPARESRKDFCTCRVVELPLKQKRTKGCRQPATSTPAPAAADDEDQNSYAAGTASPAAAKILREKGIDPAAVKGTGKDGRITKEDAEKAQAGAKPVAAQSATSAPAATPAPAVCRCTQRAS
ncbi:hypothetical protein FQR65_LT17397 [Abscondita terminalis]|nr:hypothetical protein FQR65_LT17397 [Abscondita terminalis]